MTIKAIFLVAAIGIFTSCTKMKTQEIPMEFRPLVEEFFTEAQKRNIDIELTDFDLKIEMGTTENTDIAAHCSGSLITVDSIHWDYLDEQRKKWVIFHEMGHCILDRDHKNISTDQGICSSLMRGTENDFSCSIDVYSELWWDYYLDELFNEETQFPEWSKNKKLPNLTENEVLVDTTFTNFNTPGDINLDEIIDADLQEYAIEITFKNWLHSSTPAQIFLGELSFGVGQTAFADYISISSENPSRNHYYSELYDIAENNVLTILKKGSLLDFYVDGAYIYTLENSMMKFNIIGTNNYVNPVDLGLKIILLQ